MIGKINTVCLELQSALLARALYPSGHPRIGASESKALRLLEELFVDRREVMLFAVDNRVIFDNKILPSSDTLCETLFRKLRDAGVDRVTFRAGLEACEVRSILDALAESLAGNPLVLEPTSCIRLESLQDLERRSTEEGDAPDHPVYEEASDAGEALSDVWNDVDNNRTLDTGALRGIVASLSRVVSQNAHGVLPLAPLKEHDEYTFVHTLNVAMLSTSLGQVLGFDDGSAHDLATAALLHDIGKRVIPLEILNKKGKFNDEEFALMKAHPVEGARILLNTPNVPDVATVVAYEHHVRADGSGYPRVPKGWRLSMASRIVQMADVFDALRTDRPYRPGLPVTKIVEIMQKDVGTFFDADLLDVFLRDVVYRNVSVPVPVPVAVPVPVES